MLDEHRVLEEVVKACTDAKGKNLSVLDVKEAFGLCDYFVIVSGRSDRQVQGISNKILNTLVKLHVKPDAVEGLDKAHWVLLDFGNVVVHVFYEPIRSFYDLESLWTKAKKVEVGKQYLNELDFDDDQLEAL